MVWALLSDQQMKGRQTAVCCVCVVLVPRIAYMYMHMHTARGTCRAVGNCNSNSSATAHLLLNPQMLAGGERPVLAPHSSCSAARSLGSACFADVTACLPWLCAFNFPSQHPAGC